jgi:hypothetical protein
VTRRGSWVFLLLLWPSLTVVGSSSLSGSLETTLAVNPLALGLRECVLPDTLSTLTLQAQLDGLTVKSVARFDLDGLDRLTLSAGNDSEGFAWDSTLTFHPLGETKTKTKTSTKPVQLYDWGQEYFVDFLVAEGVNATSTWFVRTSTDSTTWQTVAGPFGPAVHASGCVLVHAPIRYVELRATAGTLKASRALPQRLTIAYSDSLWKTSFSIPCASTTLSGAVALSVVGTAHVSFEVSGPESSDFSPTASVKFSLERPAARLCFEQAVLEAELPIGCVGSLTASAQVDDSGIVEVSLEAQELPAGLSWLTFSGTLTLAALSTELELEPQLALQAGPCLNLYAKALTGRLNTEITGISLYGVGMSHSWDYLKVSSLSYLDAAHRITVLGSQSCWEAITVAASVDSCCGGSTQFKCSVCFSRSSDSLFDWAETDAVLSVDAGASNSFSVSIAVEAAGLTYLACTFRVEW